MPSKTTRIGGGGSTVASDPRRSPFAAGVFFLAIEHPPLADLKIFLNLDQPIASARR